MRTDDALLLVGCGRGVVLRLVAAGVLPSMLHAVLLTHLHSDHITALNDVVTTHWVISQAPATLRVVGPARTQDVVDGTIAALEPDIEYRLAHHADVTWRPDLHVDEMMAGETFTVGATDHRPVGPPPKSPKLSQQLCRQPTVCARELHNCCERKVRTLPRCRTTGWHWRRPRSTF